ncbi:hypothetical protein J1N35_007708 [Gossypium stocksii]|uniref:Uncharacterized protein n=1 Tax=Gossypium stocksii TaxID=47602 RepID=A0A9D4AFU1_9ROSI|nr:hypothetical protein J1N35_007708 [Gossypium stocksii]
MAQDQPKVAVKPMELPTGPITRARAKKFKEAVAALIDRVWGETVVGFIERSWANNLSAPCNFLQAHLAQP